jgi:hypothetical protein
MSRWGGNRSTRTLSGRSKRGIQASSSIGKRFARRRRRRPRSRGANGGGSSVRCASFAEPTGNRRPHLPNRSPRRPGRCRRNRNSRLQRSRRSSRAHSTGPNRRLPASRCQTYRPPFPCHLRLSPRLRDGVGAGDEDGEAPPPVRPGVLRRHPPMSLGRRRKQQKSRRPPKSERTACDFQDSARAIDQSGSKCWPRTTCQEAIIGA